ncbi:hypothetical protein K440DRAFT_631262, partial [Wilcoxina mikolae CBS 423.85]
MAMESRQKNPQLFLASFRSNLGFAFMALGFVLCPDPLPIIGFGTLGPTAGSIAAMWQASIGNIPSRSLFSILQSLGM